MTQDGVESAIARAGDFVATHGDAVQRARAEALVDPAARAAAESLLATADDLAAAVAALEALDAIGIRRGPAVERAVAAIAAAQAADGSFAVAGARDEAAQIAATAHVAGLLARTVCVRPAVLDRAGAWLTPRWSVDRAQTGDVAWIGGFASFFANVDHELSDAGLQWCGRELERGFRSGAIDALAVATVLVRCDARALPGARLDAAEVVLSLLAAQAADGGFGAGTVSQRVEATLAALAALRRLGPATRVKAR